MTRRDGRRQAATFLEFLVILAALHTAVGGGVLGYAAFGVLGAVLGVLAGGVVGLAGMFVLFTLVMLAARGVMITAAFASGGPKGVRKYLREGPAARREDSPPAPLDPKQPGE